MMAIPRENVEHILNESETQHRYAHSLLKPNNLYFLYNAEEAKGMVKELPLKFIGEYISNGRRKKGQFTAMFKLIPVPKTTPQLYGYQFEGELS